MTDALEYATKHSGETDPRKLEAVERIRQGVRAIPDGLAANGRIERTRGNVARERTAKQIADELRRASR